MRLSCAIAFGFGQFFDAIDEALLVFRAIDDRFEIDHIDLAAQFALAADGHEHGPRIGPKLRAHFRNDAVEVRAEPIHLIDEREPRHTIAGRPAAKPFRIVAAHLRRLRTRRSRRRAPAWSARLPR